MSYIFCIGLKSILFNNTGPAVRVYINDYFVDEFELDKHSKIADEQHRSEIGLDQQIYSDSYQNKWLKHTSVLDKIDRKTNIPKNLKNIFNDDITLKFYEISSNIIRPENNTIKIEIINSDSNYTNGFMTKSKMLNLCVAYMLEQKHFAYPDTLLNQQNLLKERKRKESTKISSLKSFYKERKPIGNLLKKNFKTNNLFFVNKNEDKSRLIDINEFVGEPGHVLLKFDQTDVNCAVDSVYYNIDYHLFKAVTNIFSLAFHNTQ